MQRWYALTLVLALAPAGAQTGKFESTVMQARLLELYTSEGCSSCPPADSWLSSLKQDERLWRELVPVAFHVDYWDYIGWEDRFASPAHAQRQRRYVQAGNLKTVYTPGFVLNGAEWRSWFGNRQIPKFEAREVGVLRVDIDGGRGRVVFEPATTIAGQSLSAHITLLGFELKSEVAAGENRGRLLHHDFAVLGYGNVLLKLDASGYAADVQIPESELKAERMALAVWITERDELDPIQSAGGWLAGF